MKNSSIIKRWRYGLLCMCILAAFLYLCLDAQAVEAETSGDNTAVIYAGCMAEFAGETDKFTFKLESVDGPMPDGADPGGTCKTIDLSKSDGGTGEMIKGSFGKISFDRPGRYIYKVSQVLPDEIQKGMTYDQTKYFVYVFVEYRTDGTDETVDNSDDVVVTNMIVCDSQDHPESKIAAGTDEVTVVFRNILETGSFTISKNVTGNLGDIYKKFRFKIEFAGLAAGREYAIDNNGAELISGFAADRNDTDQETDIPEAFTADSDGKAELVFLLKDDSGFSFEGLPAGASLEVTEDASDHRPSYAVLRSGEEIASDSLNAQGKLSTKTIAIDEPGDYAVRFTNERTMIPVTGTISRDIGTWILLVSIVMSVMIFLRMRGKRSF